MQTWLGNEAPAPDTPPRPTLVRLADVEPAVTETRRIVQLAGEGRLTIFRHFSVLTLHGLGTEDAPFSITVEGDSHAELLRRFGGPVAAAS